MREKNDISSVKEFSSNLNKIMNSKGVRIDELSFRTKISTDQLRTYIYGTNYPSVQNLCKLCKGLNCGPNDLLTFAVYGKRERRQRYESNLI